jgi:hypothetical protein
LACQRFQAASLNPANNTVYFIGGSNNLAPATINDNRRIKALATGNITKVAMVFNLNSASGTNNPSTIKIKNITQTTEVTITTTITSSNVINAEVVNVSFPVTQGDLLTLEWTTPTYATNPSGVFSFCEFTIE